MLPQIDWAACAATPWQATPDMALRAVIAAGLLALAGWASARRQFPGQRAFVVLSVVMAAWIGISITEHAAVAAACKGTVAVLSWVAILAQPLVLTLFLHQYLNSEQRAATRRARGARVLLALPSLLLVAAAWSNGEHGLFYGPNSRMSAPVYGMQRLHYDYGPLFYAAIAVNYGWLAAVIGLLIRGFVQARGHQRRQWAAFLVMALVPMSASVAYVGFGVRLMGVDPTSSAFAVALVGFAWLMHRDRLFAVVPLARRLLFAELPDPVIVLDAEGRVAEVNEAARRLGGEPAFERPLADWPGFGAALQAHLVRGTRDDAVLELEHPQRWFEVQRRELGPAGQAIGALIQLHDVSTRQRAHNEAVRTLAAREADLDRAAADSAALREQALQDPLTGLLNRRALDERYARARRAGDAAPALVLFDLDHFKRVNDTYGHPAGDAVLRDFAQVLRGGLRAGDALFRLGGEEFALVMPATPAATALERVQQLHAAVAQRPLGGLPQAVTFSAGIAVAAEAGSTLEALIEAADQALYAAKRAGRNRSQLAGAALPEPA
jgi:diguanylate cyclase (GGDEF)-like protein